MNQNTHYDVIVLGAGAAGLMCAIEAGKRGRSVLILDHAKKPAEKIRISGGGRCNFTNMHCAPKNFLSSNPHFCKSALSAYTQHDFVALVQKHKIAFHEKTLGQLFCDNSSKDIIHMLLDELQAAGAELRLQTEISHVEKSESGFTIYSAGTELTCGKLVIATGGKSIPKMGATGFGYDVAKQFGLSIIETRPALVPFTYPADLAEAWAALSGIALNVRAKSGKASFDEAMLITHRGLSGPAILQISSYWREGETVAIDLMPMANLADDLTAARRENPKSGFAAAVEGCFSRRFAQHLSKELGLESKRLADFSNDTIKRCADAIHSYGFKPGGTEGYRTAEVTLGGVDTDGISQKTMEAKTVPGLYFIGEVVDVTGHLGGHNFQWAWASGYAAGQAV